MALHPVVRRALLLLGGSYALTWAAISMTAGPGPAALVALTGDDAHAGLFFAVFSLAAAAGSAVGGRLMDRAGRRPVLAGAHLVASAGYAAIGAAVGLASLPLFVAGLVALAAATGSVYLTRVAAAELFPAARRGRGMAWALLGAAAGALLGPALLVAGPGGAGSASPAVWLVAAPLPLLAGVLVALAPEPARIARDLERYQSDIIADRAPAPGPSAAGGLPFAAALAALALAQAAMVAVMGVAGAWLGHEDHGVGVMAAVMALHFVGMFALSPVVGHVADRAGRRATVLAGLATLAAGGLVVAFAPGVVAFGAGLFLVGLGWSFSYVGGTVLLTDVTPAARRARTLGLADLSASLLSALAAALGGAWYAARGLPGLGLAAALAMLAPLALVALLRERSPGKYGAGEAPA